MQRIFAEIANNQVLINDEDLHHLKDVLRLDVGEEVEVLSKEGPFLTRVASLSPFVLEVVAPIAEKRELDNKLAIAWSLLKGENNDWIVMKGTELGVTDFLPFLSKRSIVKADIGSEDNRLSRMKKIARSSAQQCRRATLPEVYTYAKYLDVLSANYDVKIFAWEGINGGSETLYKAALNLKKGQSVLLLIGPEGGFTEDEAKLAVEHGFQAVSLGRRILRAETAAIYAASLIGARSEEE